MTLIGYLLTSSSSASKLVRVKREELIRYIEVWDAELIEKKRRNSRWIRRAADGRLLMTPIPNDQEIPYAAVVEICLALEIPDPPNVNDEPKNAREARRDSRRKRHD